LSAITLFTTNGTAPVFIFRNGSINHSITVDELSLELFRLQIRRYVHNLNSEDGGLRFSQGHASVHLHWHPLHANTLSVQLIN
jgi:hypothetical protein